MSSEDLVNEIENIKEFMRLLKFTTETKIEKLEKDNEKQWNRIRHTENQWEARYQKLEEEVKTLNSFQISDRQHFEAQITKFFKEVEDINQVYQQDISSHEDIFKRLEKLETEMKIFFDMHMKTDRHKWDRWVKKIEEIYKPIQEKIENLESVVKQLLVFMIEDYDDMESEYWVEINPVKVLTELRQRLSGGTDKKEVIKPKRIDYEDSRPLFNNDYLKEGTEEPPHDEYCNACGKSMKKGEPYRIHIDCFDNQKHLYGERVKLKQRLKFVEELDDCVFYDGDRENPASMKIDVDKFRQLKKKYSEEQEK